MRARKRFLLAILPITSLFIACCPSNENISDEGTSVNQPISDDMKIADTIIYDVIVRNPNPHDTWTEECLQSLEHKNLIDNIFELIYSKEIIAYDYFEHTQMRVKDIKALENETDFNRENIGKIQFGEKWFLSDDNNDLKKEIISMALGYELYDAAGEVRGYSPIFMVYLK